MIVDKFRLVEFGITPTNVPYPVSARFITN